MVQNGYFVYHYGIKADPVYFIKPDRSEQFILLDLQS